MRGLLILASLATLVARADGQDLALPPGAPDPRVWVSLSAGPMTFPHLNILNIPSRDNVKQATNIRGSIEVDAGKIGGLGLAVARVTLPIQYFGDRPSPDCRSGCPATLRATSLLASLHVGGGLGIDQAMEASVGLTHFGDLRTSVETPAVRQAANDLTAMLGYGLAYGFNSRLSATFMGDLGMAFHRTRTRGLEPWGYSYYVGLRAGLRYGLLSHTH